MGEGVREMGWAERPAAGVAHGRRGCGARRGWNLGAAAWVRRAPNRKGRPAAAAAAAAHSHRKGEEDGEGG